jgi:predicted nucleic acid-binding protein
LVALTNEFSDRTLGFDAPAAPFAAMIARLRTRDYPDVLIAATALSHGLGVATRNVKHFDDIPGLAVVDPWA